MEISNQYILNELKVLLNEDDFKTGFAKIKKDDKIFITTDDRTISGTVLDKQLNQVIVLFKNEKFMFTSASFGEDYLLYARIPQSGKPIKARLNNVKNIIVKRGNVTISNISSTIGKENEKEDVGSEAYFNKLRDDLLNDLSSLDVNKKIIIRCGKTILNGKDRGKINKSTMSEYIINITKKNTNLAIGALKSAKGFNSAKFKDLISKRVMFKIPDSLIVNDLNGEPKVILVIKDIATNTKYRFEDVYDFEIVNMKEHKISYDTIMNDPDISSDFKNMMLKSPNLLQKIIGMNKDGKGVLALNKLIDKFDVSNNFFKKNQKVTFRYNGKNHFISNDISLINNREYNGVFKDEKTIVVKKKYKPNEQIQIRLNQNVSNNTYVSHVTYVNLIHPDDNVNLGNSNITILKKENS